MRPPAEPVSPALVRLRWLGFAGSVVLAVGATGAGVLPRPDTLSANPVLRAMRTYPGVWVCVALAALGMAMLVAAWWPMRSADLRPRWMTVTAAWWALPLSVIPPLASRDAYSYAAQGDLLLNGFDPYAVGPGALQSPWLGSVSVTWVDTPAPYGPLYLELAQVAVALSGHLLPVAILLLRVIAIVGVALLAVYLPRLARACGVDPGRALWLAVASPLVLAHFVGGAHNDALMVGLLVAGLAYAAERKGVLAVVFVALAATVKAPALVALPFVALLWSIRMPAGRLAVIKAGALAGAIAAATFAAVTLATGLGTGWIGAAAGTPGLTVQWTSLPTGLGMAAGMVAEGLGLPVRADTCIAVARAIGTLVMLAALVTIFVRAWRRAGDVRFVVASAGWALLAVVVLAPAFHPWYLPWALAPLAAATVDKRVFTGLAAVSAALCFLVKPDGWNLARAIDGPGAAFDVIVLIVLIVIVVRRLRSARGARQGDGPVEKAPVATAP